MYFCVSIIFFVNFLCGYVEMTNEQSLLLNGYSECGKHHQLVPKIGSRVIGGQDARLGEFPWMALLVIPSLFDIKLCDGSLINKRYVLTAGHCFFSFLPTDKKYMTVKVGEYDLEHEQDCEDGVCAPPVQEYKVDEISVHENYTGKLSDHHNDIALVRTTQDVEFNKFVYPVCLPFDRDIISEIVGGRDAIMTGWGNREEAPKLVPATVLQKASAKIWDQDICRKIWGDNYTTRHRAYDIIDSQLCAEGEGDKFGRLCHGDSGGPLVIVTTLEDGSISFVQIGIASLATACIEGDKDSEPSVFTRLTTFMPWITSHMKE